ncbi:MAG: cytochrome P450, partial [Anaerolineae bacterium]
METPTAEIWHIGETDAPLPPLAPGLPLLGNAIQMGGDTVRFLAGMYQQLGPVFRVRALTRELVILGGLDANRFMAQAGDSVLSGSEFFGGLNDELDSTLVFPALDGDEHRYYRKLFRPSYSRDAVAGRFDELMALTRRRMATFAVGERIQAVPTMQQIITDQLGYALAGSVSGEYFDDLRGTLSTLIATKLMKSAPEFMLRLPNYRRKRERSQAFMRQLLELHRAHPHAENGDLIDAALRATGYDGQPLSIKDLEAIGFGAFFAGMDTAAHTTSFTLYLLLKHPAIMRQAVAEIDDLFAQEAFTFRDLRHMKTLHAAVIEGMRLYPVAPIMPRHATQTFEFGGYRVQQGAHIMMVTALTHYLPEHFPNPETFDITRP